MNVPHRFVYGAIAMTYAWVCVGLDKTVAAALLALAYVLLALNSPISDVPD